MRPKSVLMGRDPEVLKTLFAFHAPNAAVCRDVTANKRRMWKGIEAPRDTRFYDIDAGMAPDEVCSFTALPDADGTVHVLVFDPPHLPSAAASPKSMNRFATDYGLGESRPDDSIAWTFKGFLLEAQRVLKDDGLIFAKLCDYVHNHKRQWILADFINAVRSVGGLTPCDLIVKIDPSAGNLASGRWEKAMHTRNSHAWWVVVRKGRCEPCKPLVEGGERR